MSVKIRTMITIHGIRQTIGFAEMVSQRKVTGMADRPHYMIVPGINMTMAKQKIEEEKITGMADLDKVIKGLEHCKRESEHIDDNPCNGCPYYELKECQQMMADALELMKSQQQEIAYLKPHYEPRKPTGIHIWHHGYIGHCPSCDRVVDFAERFCHTFMRLSSL